MGVSDVAGKRAHAATRQFRVLVVDDDPAIRLLCAESLRHEGHDVIEACDGQEALELVFSAAPDLVLLDISMPILDGFAVAAALRADERTRLLPLVFLTGEVDPRTEERVYEAGAAGFFAKPFDPSVVGSFIQRVLAQLVPEPRRLSGTSGHPFWG